MKNVFNAKRVLTALTLALSTAVFTLPATAVEVTQGDVLGKVNGNYGANLDSVVGAKVDTDLNHATITNTQTNSVLNWNELNTAPRQSLTYIMSDGQMSLNNVIGTSISKFAGSLKAEHGRVIISNPNGIIFENGSYVNANALTLTTHYATIDGDKLKLTTYDNNASIIFEGGQVATSKVRFNIAKDLNIVSNNIDVTNADIVAQDIRLLTTDGVTFFAVNNTQAVNDYTSKVYRTNDNIVDGNININSSKFAVKDSTTGKVSIVARGNAYVNKTNLDGVTVANGNKVTFDKVASNNTVKATGDSVAMYNSTVDNIAFEAKNNVKVQNVKATGNAVSEIKTGKAEVKSSQFKTIRAAAADITFTDTNVNNANLQATNNIKVSRSNSKNTYSINNSTLTAGNIDVDNTAISDSLLIATNNINANKTSISNTEMNATRNVYAGEANIINSNLTADNDVSLANSVVTNSVLKATKDLKLQNSKLNNTEATGRYGFLNNATLENGTSVAVDTVTGNTYTQNDTVKNLVIKNSKLKSNKNNINLKNARIENGTLETADGKDVNIDANFGDVKLVGSKIGGNLNVTNAKSLVISNSKEAGNQYIPNLTNKSSITDYDRTKFDNNYFENIINNYGRDYGNNTNLSVIKGNVNISDTKNSLIINSIIGGNVTSNVYGESNVVRSMIEGNYNPTKIATATTGVYESFIGGNYERRFNGSPVTLPELNPSRPVVVDNPTTLPETNPRGIVETPEQPQAEINNSDDRTRLTYSDEANKRKFGNGINTSFQRRFLPRGFAAQEDEIKEMKNSTKSSIVKTENNNIKITKSFYAY